MSFKREIVDVWTCDNCGIKAQQSCNEYEGSPSILPAVVPNAGWVKLFGSFVRVHYCPVCAPKMSCKP